MKQREAVVAGLFYPQSAQQLEAEVVSFLTPLSEPKIPIQALIAPHAGYCYSGAVAGKAYAYLKSIAPVIKRVILLGPSHRVALRGGALCDYGEYSTPLGDVEVEQGSYEQLLKLDEVSLNNQAHALEHSLEVQLPFLQYCLADFKLLPIVVGYCQPDTISNILHTLKANDPSTLVVVSSDLSHYHTYQEAQRLDNHTINKILNYDNSLAGEDACGCFAVNGLLDYAKCQKWKIKLIKKANSGDTAGDKQRVVGYGSFILY